tara:strand:+ start:4337 stop:4519 length:183 start_codon:yes stop_codon:yes gene_type:complete
MQLGMMCFVAVSSAKNFDRQEIIYLVTATALEFILLRVYFFYFYLKGTVSLKGKWTVCLL